MKFGVFVNAQQPRSDDPVRRFREAVEQTRSAKAAGFDALAAGHHYLSPPYQSLQSLPLLSRLAGEAEGMELCLSVLLLAMLNPVQTAEEVASLDIMSGGKVVFGIGIGYRDVEFEAFNMTSRERVPRMLEALDLIKRLWTEEVVTFEGKFFRVHNATCTIRPVQKPLPPIWIAANADPAVVRTARLGYSWFVNPHAALPTIERQWDRYKQALAEANQPMPAVRPIALELHVAPTHEEAVNTARPYLESKYAAYAEWGQDKVLPGEESFRIAFDDLARDRFILGTPDEVIEQIEERVKRLESNYLIFRMGWPGMEGSKILRAIEMMGQKVLPHFHAKYGRG
ncbi:MAG TPA: LLM class flavin-dependent oxidoreductase [Stellaceae bacterium]|jgi:alkanesulfonate monooxygenase SsuD/methylene tetrahydromethanopterin reductase-like flavin-dependent oxidoreductase (luciferase family)|nr:LLM class flavin-dependent oxidoreductase [Stellaceae bacterium]